MFYDPYQIELQFPADQLDGNQELARFKFVAFSLLLFVVAGFKSCEELKCITSGRTAEATVVSVKEERGRRMRHVGYRVTYRFRKDGRSVDGWSVVGTDEVQDYRAGRKVEIEYVGGRLFTTRFKGDRNWFWIAVLLLGLLAVAGSAFALYREADSKVGRKG